VRDISLVHFHCIPPEQSTGTVTPNPRLRHEDGSVPDLEQALASIQRKAVSFAERHKGKLPEAAKDRDRLLAAVRDYESIHEQAMDPYLSARLLHAWDTRNHEFARLYRKVREAWSEARGALAFFPLELAALPEKLLHDLVEDETFASYRRFLLRLNRQKPYFLSEPEERIVQRQSLAGKKSLEERYDSLMGSLAFPVQIDGKRKNLHAAQVLARRNDPERSVRKRCHQAYMEKLEANGAVFVSVLNALILDHLREDRLRGYPFPIHRRHMANEADASVIETMMKVVERRYPPARRYFRLKAGSLGLKRLKTFDMSAPIGSAQSMMRISMARKYILDAAADFHPLFHSAASSFFENGWIDTKMRQGKLDGAFCLCFGPGQHPTISMNYAGRLRDALVLAHELGHGIHYRLARKQTYFNFRPPPILEEAASTFMEILLVRHLLEKRTGEVDPGALMAAHLDGIVTTVSRQNVITRFEQSLYRARQDHYLDAEEICGFWRDENAVLFGKNVDMTPPDRWGWAGVPHIFHRPFYCYAYVFGNLLAMALYREWEGGGTAAVEDIIRLLSSGGAEAPVHLLEEMGLTPRKASFWEDAFTYVEDLIDLFGRFSHIHL